MFPLFSPATGFIGPGSSSLAASVTSAIAYGEGMEHVRITARAEHGMVRLVGTAPTLKIANRAIEIAVEVAGCNVRSDIALKHHSTDRGAICSKLPQQAASKRLPAMLVRLLPKPNF